MRNARTLPRIISCLAVSLSLVTAPGLALRAERALETGPRIDSPGLPAASVAEIRNVILGQLDAFRVDDAEKAFSFAAPQIKRVFGTPEMFLFVVRKSYRAVYRPKSFEFRDLTRIEGNIVQPLAVVGPTGVSETALYVMERQSDGSWKIAACIMAREPGQDA